LGINLDDLRREQLRDVAEAAEPVPVPETDAGLSGATRLSRDDGF